MHKLFIRFFFGLLLASSVFGQDRIILKFEHHAFGKKVVINDVSADSIIFKTGPEVHRWPIDLIIAYKKNFTQPGPYIFVNPKDTSEYEVTEKGVNFIGSRIKGSRNGYDLTTKNLMRPYLVPSLNSEKPANDYCLDFLHVTDSVYTSYSPDQVRRIFIILKEDDDRRVITSKEFKFTDTGVIMRFEKHHVGQTGVFHYRHIASVGIQTYKMKKAQYWIMVPAIPFAIAAIAFVPSNAALIARMYENYYRRFDLITKSTFRPRKCSEPAPVTHELTPVKKENPDPTKE